MIYVPYNPWKQLINLHLEEKGPRQSLCFVNEFEHFSLGTTWQTDVSGDHSSVSVPYDAVIKFLVIILWEAFLLLLWEYSGNMCVFVLQTAWFEQIFFILLFLFWCRTRDLWKCDAGALITMLHYFCSKWIVLLLCFDFWQMQILSRRILWSRWAAGYVPISSPLKQNAALNLWTNVTFYI